MQLFTGLKFFGDLYGLNTNDVFAAFSFYSGFRNNNIVYPESWATNSASGILNNTGQFFSRSGSGFFNGNTFMRLNQKYVADNSTIFLSYQKSRLEDEILISSVTGNNFSNYSGFCLGVNDANKLYFKYWNPVEGSFTFTYNGVLSDKNLIILNKNESTVSLGHYNTNTSSFQIENFNIFRNSFAESDFLNIGGKPNNVEWVTSNNLSGHIDKLYIFNNIDFYVYKNNIASGLFNVVTGFQGETIRECYETGFFRESGYLYWQTTGTSLSGYQTGRFQLTGYSSSGSGYFYSGVTGYNTISVGFYTDNCGNSTEIFERIALSGRLSGSINVNVPLYGTVFSTEYIETVLSGLLSGNVLIPVTGQVCNDRIVLIDGFTSLTDVNYLRSLSYNEITLFSNTQTQNDIVEIFTEPYQNKTLEYNKNLLYDNFNNNYFYIDREFKQNEILLFGNGQALIDSGYQLIPSGYETIRSPNLDYFITGTTVETNKFFVDEDNLFYDYINGKFIGFKTDKGIFSLPNDIDENYWLFQNGQKLIKSIDYLDFRTGYTIKDKILGDSAFDTLRVTSSNEDSTVLCFGGLGDSQNGSSAGAVWVYTGNANNGWGLRQKLSGDTPNDYFGSSISLNRDGSILCAGGYFDQEGGVNAGAVWVYTGNSTNGWVFKNKLTGATQDLFGFNVSISSNSNVIVVGARHVLNNAESGKMYIYTGNANNGWNLKQIITGNNINYLNIGRDVKSNKNGEILLSTTNSLSTSVAIFTGNSIVGWTYKQSLPNFLSPNNIFEGNLDLNANGDLIVVGAPFDNLSGSVSIYSGNSNIGWTLSQKLLGDAFNAGFGRAIAISKNNNIITVGKPLDSTLLPNAGATYIYNYNPTSQWQLNQILFGDRSQNRYGNDSITINDNGSVILMSSQLDKDNGLDAGAALIYNKEDPKIQILNHNNEENYYIVKEIPDNFIYYSGNSGSFRITSTFNHGCSQVYYNGIKQKINSNYIENARFDLISGNFYDADGTDKIIYNNSDDFFV